MEKMISLSCVGPRYTRIESYELLEYPLSVAT